MELEKEFDEIIGECSSLFENKLKDYGPTWLFYRNISLLDQLWIKAKRISVLEENNDNTLVGEDRDGEYIGIINYSVVMLFRFLHKDKFPSYEDVLTEPEKADEVPLDTIMECYRKTTDDIKQLMLKKNHDYGDAWRGMNLKSITDMIIIKLSRIKKILKNNGELLVSENIDAQLYDAVNYAVFGLIRLREGK